MLFIPSFVILRLLFLLHLDIMLKSVVLLEVTRLVLVGGAIVSPFVVLQILISAMIFPIILEFQLVAATLTVLLVLAFHFFLQRMWLAVMAIIVVGVVRVVALCTAIPPLTIGGRGSTQATIIVRAAPTTSSTTSAMSSPLQLIQLKLHKPWL